MFEQQTKNINIMRNQIISGVGALALALMTVTPSFASTTFSDSEYIGDWAKPSVDALVELGVMSGYPDGSFGPYWSITREEYAVSLLKGLEVLDNAIYEAQQAHEAEVYAELVDQQIALMEALVSIDELKAINALQHNNYVALGLGYNVSNGVQDDQSSIQLLGKVQVVKLSDKLAISVRPFVTTDATAGASATLDYAISNKLGIYAGGGAAASWNNGSSELTGTNDVVGIAQGGVEYKLSKDTVTGIDVKVPVNGDNAGDPVLTGFVGISF